MVRHCFLYFLIFISSFYSFAASDKEYKKIASRYDVPIEVRELKDTNRTIFWQVLTDNNESLQKFMREIKRNKGAAKEALNKYSETPKYYPLYDESILLDFQGVCDTSLLELGIYQFDRNVSLHIVKDSDVNAYCVPTENGFAICITSGLLEKKGCTSNMLIGIIAHEFAHGILKHHIRSFYSEAKERRKNQILGGIAAGLNSIAATADAYTSAITGTKANTDYYTSKISQIEGQIYTSTKLFTCKYSREQEYEADLVGFRFMQFLGLEDEYIEMLRFLGSDYDNLYSEWSDHPTTTSRINFLNYIKEHPEIYNTNNSKIKKNTIREKDNLYE